MTLLWRQNSTARETSNKAAMYAVYTAVTHDESRQPCFMQGGGPYHNIRNSGVRSTDSKLQRKTEGLPDFKVFGGTE